MVGSKNKLLWLLLSIFLIGCSTVPKKLNNEQREDFAISSIADGPSASKLNKKSEELSAEDLLELSTYARYGKSNDLSKSSIGYLIVDKNISDWEKTTTEKINASLSEFIAYSFGSFGDLSIYQPRPYESTMLSFNLALNHSISGNNNLAAIEARKIAEKEAFIERLNVKTLEAIKEQEKIDYDLGQSAKSISKIEMIEDYPIEIFKSKNNEINVRNSYQSAAANFLAGYIFESEGDKSLASPAYIKSIELMPSSKLFIDSLLNLDKKKDTQNISDVLFIFELGLSPKLVTRKYRFNVLTKVGPKSTSILLPVLSDPDKKPEKLSKVFIDQKQLNPELTVDISQMIKRDLQDSMPKYLTMATTKALLEISSQISLRYFTKGLEKTDKGLTRLLGTAMLWGLYSRGDFDVRSWDSLPESIYMSRSSIPYGEHEITFQPNYKPKAIKVQIEKPHQIINIRIIDRSSFLVTNNLNKTKDEYFEDVMNVAK